MWISNSILNTGLKVEEYNDSIFDIVNSKGSIEITKKHNDNFHNVLTNQIKMSSEIKLTVLNNPNTHGLNCLLVGIHEKKFFKIEGHIYNNKGLYVSDGKTVYKEPSKYISTKVNFISKGDYVIIYVNLAKKILIFKDKKGHSCEHDLSGMNIKDIHFSFLIWFSKTKIKIERSKEIK